MGYLQIHEAEDIMTNNKPKKIKKISLELSVSDWIASATLILFSLFFMYIAFSMISGQQNQIASLNKWLESNNSDTNEITHLVKKDMYLTNGSIRFFFILSYMCFFLLFFYCFIKNKKKEK